jgi:hypothetical protein
MIELTLLQLILAMFVVYMLGAIITYTWGSRDRRLAKQFIRAKIVVANVDLWKTVPIEIWEAVAPHERD